MGRGPWSLHRMIASLRRQVTARSIFHLLVAIFARTVLVWRPSGFDGGSSWQWIPPLPESQPENREIALEVDRAVSESLLGFKNIDRKYPIVFSTAGSSHADFAEMFFRSLKTHAPMLESKYVLFAFDDKMLQSCKNIGMYCVASPPSLRIAGGMSAGNRDSTFNHIAVLKWMVANFLCCV